MPGIGSSLVLGLALAATVVADPATPTTSASAPLFPPGLRVVDTAHGPGLPEDAAGVILAMDEAWVPSMHLLDGNGRVSRAIAVPREAASRQYLALAVHEGRPVLVGGVAPDPTATASAEIVASMVGEEQIDGARDFQELPALPAPRARHAAVGTPAGLLVAGGLTGTTADTMQPAPDALRLDASGAWTRILLPGPRVDGLAVALDQRAVLLGGRTAIGGEPVHRVDVIDQNGLVRSWMPAADGITPIPIAATVLTGGPDDARVRVVDEAGRVFDLMVNAELAPRWRRVGAAAWPRRFPELLSTPSGGAWLLGGFRGSRPVRAIEQLGSTAISGDAASGASAVTGLPSTILVAGPYEIPGPPVPAGFPTELTVGATRDLGAMLDGVMLVHAGAPAGGGFTWTLDAPQLEWRPLGGVPTAVRATRIGIDGRRAFLLGPHASPAVPAYQRGDRGWSWREPGPPDHAEGAAFVAHRMRWYAFGGERDGRPTDAVSVRAWVDDTAPFSSASASLPAPRRDAVAAVDGEDIVIAGGLDKDGRALGEVLRFNPARRTFTELPPLPEPSVLADLVARGGALLATRRGGRKPWILVPGADAWAPVSLPGDLPQPSEGDLVAGAGDDGFLLLRRSTDGSARVWRLRVSAD
jgi:hypothetical protein